MHSHHGQTTGTVIHIDGFVGHTADHGSPPGRWYACRLTVDAREVWRAIIIDAELGRLTGNPQNRTAIARWADGVATTGRPMDPSQIADWRHA